ncbi:MAG: hypothetical protein WA981_17075 [Glaciecola sp.]
MNVPAKQLQQNVLTPEQLSQISGGNVGDIASPYLLLVPRNDRELQEMLANQFQHISQ